MGTHVLGLGLGAFLIVLFSLVWVLTAVATLVSSRRQPAPVALASIALLVVVLVVALSPRESTAATPSVTSTFYRDHSLMLALMVVSAALGGGAAGWSVLVAPRAARVVR